MIERNNNRLAEDADKFIEYHVTEDGNLLLDEFGTWLNIRAYLGTVHPNAEIFICNEGRGER